MFVIMVDFQRLTFKENNHYLTLFFIFISIIASNFVFSKEIGENAQFSVHQSPFLDKNLEKWELIDIHFLTGIRSKRDINEKPFHILELEIPLDSEENQNQTVHIHLVKKYDLISPNLRILVNENDNEIFEERYQIDETTSEDCFYRGNVYSNFSKISNGKVALYSCSHDRHGFNGLIIMPNGQQLMIQPHLDTKNQPSYSNTLPHRILRIESEKKEKSVNCDSDELRLSNEELFDAEKLSKEDFQTRVKRTEEGSETTIKNNIKSTNARQRIESSDQMELNPQSKSTSFPETEKKVVELAVFTDEDLYHDMRKIYVKDTTKKLKDFVLSMINTIDLLYEQESLNVSISFRLVHLEIIKRQPYKLSRQEGRAKAYLTTFCDYAGDKNANMGLWDHALLLTGMDLRENNNKATAGLAWAGTMCYRYYSCSLSEGSSFGASFIIAHEIGHSLGIEHDGYGISSNCDEEKFLMSPTTGAGKITWSKCSTQNLKDFLEYGSSEARVSTSEALPPLCLSEIVSDQNPKRIIDYNEDKKLPGEKYDVDQQCIFSMGKGHKPVMRKQHPFDNICWMLYCGNGTHAISTHPALEGSKCEDGKFCRAGECILTSNKIATK